MVVVGVVGGGGLGLEPRLSLCATEELDAVDVVSSALAVVSLGSLGFEELVFESIPVATALGLCGVGHVFMTLGVRCCAVSKADRIHTGTCRDSYYIHRYPGKEKREIYIPWNLMYHGLI